MSEEKHIPGGNKVGEHDKNHAVNDEKKPYRGKNAAKPWQKTTFGSGRVGNHADRRGPGAPAQKRRVGDRPYAAGNRSAQNRDQVGEAARYAPKTPAEIKGKVGDKPYRRPEGRPEARTSGEKRHFRGNGAPIRHENGPMRGHAVGKSFQGAPKRPGNRPAVPTDGMPARRLALEIIRQVTENGAYASLCLDEKLRGCGLSPEDRRLVSRLVYDTLEHVMYLDHALDQVMARPDTDIKLRNILRLGACQILLEDRIPESAATNTSVNLCKELGMEGLAGVCNGVLRNLIRQKDELTWPDEEAEPIRALSIRYSVPAWLVERLMADWGHDTAVGLMQGHHEASYTTLRPNLTKLDDDAFEALLKKKVWQYEKGQVPHAWRVRGIMDIALDIDFARGNYAIEGESSMMACMALEPRRGMTVLDCCAAPGGKTCYLAEMMGGTGRVQAWDVHAHRADLVAAQARRLQLENVRPMMRDALKMRDDLRETMDAVLLDAPCSGTGDMADKPDVKLRVTEESVRELAETQKSLLDTVCAYVKRGGVMVYSTCSVLKDENEHQIAAFLERHPEFTLEKMPESIPEKFRAQEGTGLQLMPHRDGVGGFYIARLRRKRL